MHVICLTSTNMSTCCLFVFPLIPSEKRLHSMNQLVDHPNSVQYFWPDQPIGHIQDDHIPFLNRGITATTDNHHSISCSSVG